MITKKPCSYAGLFCINIRVQYTYDATGQKLKKVSNYGGNLTITDYIGGIHYENNLVSFVQTAEGRVRKEGTSWIYEYNLTDHLGNVRVSFDKNPSTGVARLIQKDDYYPFGGTFNHPNVAGDNKYLYNGKELQQETDWYDYGARMYDAALGRWMVVDPLADSSWSYTPYHYVANNPIIFIDPDGRDFIIWYENEDGKQDSFRFNGKNGGNAPKNEFVQNFLTAYNYNVKNGGGEKLQAIAGNKNVIIGVAQTDNSSQHDDGYIYWNPNAGSEYENGTVVSPATILEHEADHANQRVTNYKQYIKDRQSDAEELRVINGTEQKTARANGEISASGVTRTRHEGKSVITYGPTSNKVNRVATSKYLQKLKDRALESLDQGW